eukprot:6584007-Pyramimonas_sp.AAC.1
MHLPGQPFITRGDVLRLDAEVVVQDLAQLLLALLQADEPPQSGEPRVVQGRLVVCAHLVL